MDKNDKVQKIVHFVLKIILTLLLIMPILGTLGIFPQPTREMYNSDAAFRFIDIMSHDAHYIQYTLALIFVISGVLIWVGREALATILITPITINIILFHAFLDGGLFTAGAIMGNILGLINAYLLWYNKDSYKMLLDKKIDIN